MEIAAMLAQYMKKNKLTFEALSKECGLEIPRIKALLSGEDASPEETKTVTGLVTPDQAEKAADEVTEVDQVEASRSEPVDLVTMTGHKDPRKQAGVLAAVYAKAKAYDEDHAMLIKLSKDYETVQRSELVKRGKVEGKLTPGLIRYWASRSIEEFGAFLDHAPVIVGGEVRETEGKEVSLLSRDDREVAALLNQDEAELSKFVEEQRSGKVAQKIAQTYFVRASRAK